MRLFLLAPVVEERPGRLGDILDVRTTVHAVVRPRPRARGLGSGEPCSCREPDAECLGERQPPSPGWWCALVSAARGVASGRIRTPAPGFTVINSLRTLDVVATTARLRCDGPCIARGAWGGVSIEKGVGMMPCSSKVKFGWARCRTLLTRMLVVMGFTLAAGLAAGATPALASTPCAPGSYSSTGDQPCTPASPGSSVASTGATSAMPCALGTYQPSSGQISCLNAPAGSFVASTGATSATPCALATYQPSTGQASCLLAPIGSYVSTTGATSATTCPTGTTTTTTGSTSIADCHPPTPTTADQCKHDGWRHLVDRNGTPFKNQGDCVSYVATGGRNLANGPPPTSSPTPGSTPVAGSPAGAPSAPSTNAKQSKSSRHHRHGKHRRKAARRFHHHS
jgi:Tyrosine-protein kinase ephrin type A/B receptor-like